MTTGGAKLPAPQRRMGRRRREEGPALDRERLVETVLRLAEGEGEDAINMRRVATELGVSPRLLYSHVHDKAELIDLLLDAITLQIPFPNEDLPWDERLRRIARDTREVLLRYRGAPYRSLVASTQTAQAAPMQRIEAVIKAALMEAGLAPDQVEAAYLALSTFSMGHMIVSEAYATGDAPADRQGIAPGQLDQMFWAGFEIVLDGIRRVGADGQA